MTNPSDHTPQEPMNPSRRDRLKPLELLGFSGVLAVFAGLIVLMASRSIVLALIFTAIAFIMSLLFVALLGLGGKPSDEDLEARKDLKKPEGDWH
ncbi:ABC transporter ATP-binding protein [Leucobacter aridicollis]|uniref:Membrane protein implicated in regulation of membrane protease activity n=1 Tax=Leucobacter aridicollis TaxID=283878 RepID=A0A852RHM9_9MICO|nr:ABC transporter ATP-binding protein [Leucobacter aridicollis]MBL3683587.1 ABC transporter ATP-binding protein [Leucobacter aridicollis]NYD28360.1 membrane protein implicated in regulation of membrane protease activity [Leucobacter aridicollis]